MVFIHNANIGTRKPCSGFTPAETSTNPDTSPGTRL